MFVLCQPDDSLVIFHVVGKGDADATYWVLHDPIEEKGNVGHEFTHPVRVGALGNGPLEYVWLADSFKKTIKVSSICYQ